METICIPRLVKPEDMNHHGTLYAGRMADWFVEACYMCAARSAGLPGTMVFLRIHDLVYKIPVHGGDILTIEARAAKAGKTSLTVYGKMVSGDGSRIQAEGFFTFVCIDQHHRPVAHGLTLPPARDDEDIAIRKRAAAL
jgi:acyl-CoA hydrolase